MYGFDHELKFKTVTIPIPLISHNVGKQTWLGRISKLYINPNIHIRYVRKATISQWAILTSLPRPISVYSELLLGQHNNRVNIRVSSQSIALAWSMNFLCTNEGGKYLCMDKSIFEGANMKRITLLSKQVRYILCARPWIKINELLKSVLI